MILLGTTGWETNIESLDNRIYPVEHRGEKLRYYSLFSTMVELQSTFYEIPEKSVVARWEESTPKKFDFIARMHKDVTLNRKQEIDPEFIERYFDSIGGLNNKLSLVLFHFNRFFQKNDSNVEYLYNLLDESKKHCNQHFVLELVHNSWFRADDELRDALKSRSSSMLNTDKRTVTPALVPVASLGKKVQDRNRDLQFYAKYLSSIKKRYHVIFVTIDNHFSGYAWDDLLFLGSELHKTKTRFKGFMEKNPPQRKKEVQRRKAGKDKAKKIPEASDEKDVEELTEKRDTKEKSDGKEKSKESATAEEKTDIESGKDTEEKDAEVLTEKTV